MRPPRLENGGMPPQPVDGDPRLVQPPQPDDVPAPRCGECGYDLRGSRRSDQCPECGASLTADDHWPEDPAALDPGSALERSGFDLLAWTSWISAAAMSGLLAIPWFGAVAMLVLWLGTLGRLVGWWRFRNGPLRRFDDVGFERAITVPALSEPAAGLVCFILAVAAVTRGLPTWSIFIALAGWSIAGMSGLVLPAIAAIRLGHRIDDAAMRFIGWLVIVLTLCVGLLSLGILAARAAVADSLVTWSWDIGAPILIGTALTTIACFAIAHLTNVLIHGIEGVLLDSHIDARDRGPLHVKIGGALITVGDGAKQSTRPSGGADGRPLPLEDGPAETDRS